MPSAWDKLYKMEPVSQSAMFGTIVLHDAVAAPIRRMPKLGNTSAYECHAGPEPE